MVERMNCGVMLFLYLKAALGELCYYNNYQDTRYCSFGCCGIYNHQDCCSNTEDYAGIIFGALVSSVVAFILIVSVIAAVCYCCRKARGQTEQVLQSTYPAIAVFGGQNSNPCNSQVGYVNGSMSAQILPANVQPSSAQTWESPPSMDERTSP